MLKGNDVLKGVKAVVVMAHVFNEGKGALTFAYPPVDMGDDVDFDIILRKQKHYFIFKFIIGVIVSVYLLVMGAIWLFKKKSQQEFDQQAREPGIHMRDLQSVGSAMSQNATMHTDYADSQSADQPS